MGEKWRLYSCGTRGSISVFDDEFSEFGGATTCYVLKRGNYALILDCGSGLVNAEEILKDCQKIDIILTHFHYDHIIGLMAWHVIPKKAKVEFYISQAQTGQCDSLSNFLKEPYWPINPIKHGCHNLEKEIQYQIEEGLWISFYPSNHQGESNLVRIDTDIVSIAVLFDFEHGLPISKELLNKIDVMIYDGMFSKEEYQKFVGWGHSYWEKGLEIARENHVKHLWLTHYSPNKTDQCLTAMENAAQKMDENIRFIRMFDQYTFSKEDGCLQIERK